MIGKSLIDNPHSINALDIYLSKQQIKKTKQHYIGYIRHFFGNKSPSWEEINLLTREHIIDWRNQVWAEGEGLSASKINIILVSLRSLYDYLIVHGLVTYNPVSAIRGIKIERRDNSNIRITKEELGKLLSACKEEKNKKTCIRDYTVISLIYNYFLRRSEIAALKWGDIEQDGSQSLLRFEKTTAGVNDFVHIDPAMFKLLNRYYMEMGGAKCWLTRQSKPIEECHIFVALDNGRHGKPISDHSVNLIIKKRAKIAAIKPITAHTLRYSGIAHAIMDGCPIYDVLKRARKFDINQIGNDKKLCALMQ